jgi:hypothetical protein
MSGDPAAEYDAYLARFRAELGDDVDLGDFGKFRGRLIKKMTAAEFDVVNAEYHQLAMAYFESIDRGDTINDVVVRLIRDAAAKLVLTPPV